MYIINYNDATVSAKNNIVKLKALHHLDFPCPYASSDTLLSQRPNDIPL